jgi:hypothetical protein
MASESRRPAGGENDWLTLGQAAKFLGVAQSTIRKWSDLGACPPSTRPAAPPLQARDLEAFLERSGPAQPRAAARAARRRRPAGA